MDTSHSSAIVWTQGQLGKKLGVTGKQVSNYENGKLLPPQDILLKMADLLIANMVTCLEKNVIKTGQSLIQQYVIFWV